jgi:hypothetical protein
MTSAINPNNVDPNYPVAGVPNNTQGFRDNFANIKTNFQYAEDEINELQEKALFKAAIAGTTLDNNMNDNLLYAARIQDFGATVVQIATTSGSIEVDYSAGHYQTISTTGSVNLSFANFPESGIAGFMRIRFSIANVAHTVTLPATVSLGLTGVQGLISTFSLTPPFSLVSSTITFGATGIYEFGFLTITGGTIITLFDLNRPLNYYTNAVTIANSADSTSTTTGALKVAGGAGIVDNLYVGGNIVSNNAIVSSYSKGGIGYSTGAGSTVTQTGSKSDPVSLNNVCGRITTHTATLNAGAEVSFTFNNAEIEATDVVVVSIASGATAGAYNVQVDAVATNSCRISISNLSAGNLSEALVLNYVVIRSVTS